MNMFPPGHEPFLATILDDPAADGPRLVFADWLEEQGDPRSEFIRVQVELSQLPANDPQRERLADRETALLNRHGVDWRQDVPEWARHGCDFVRGLIEHVHLWSPWQARFGPILSQLAPVRKLTMQFAVEGLDEFAAGPWVRHLTDLAFLDEQMGPTNLQVLTQSETALLGIRSLQFMGMHLLDAGLLVLTLCEHLSELTRLELIRCKIGVMGIERLAESANLPALTWLDLSDNDLGNHNVWRLMESPLMGQISHLHLNDNDFTTEAASWIAESKFAGKLTHLELSNCHIGDAGIAKS